jgi:hypothetical protein
MSMQNEQLFFEWPEEALLSVGLAEGDEAVELAQSVPDAAVEIAESAEAEEAEPVAESAESTSDANSAGSSPQKRRRQLHRAVLRWLVDEQQATSVATEVATRIARLRVDIAACLSRSVRNRSGQGPRKLLEPERTIVVQCYAEREECWPNCGRAEEQVAKMRELKAKRTELEASLREKEPHLRAPDTLFEEYAEWRYEKSTNAEYQSLCRDIAQAEKALYRGTQFEQIHSACLADERYLAVPEHVVEPDELCEDWGLLWVDDELNVRVVTPAPIDQCPAANRTHLVQNISVAATKKVMFSVGLQCGRDGVSFVQPPRGYRKSQRPSLND